MGNSLAFIINIFINIIDYCVVEVNEDGIEIINDVELLNYANHKFASRDEDIFVNEVDVLVRTSILDIEQQIEMMGCILDLVLQKLLRYFKLLMCQERVQFSKCGS